MRKTYKHVKQKRTILSFLLSCIYIFATLGPVLFNTCACCAQHGHAVCERCCHCSREGRSNDGSRHFACNCACHVHSHEAADNSAVVLSQERYDLSKKLLKRVSAEAGALCVLPAEVKISLLRGSSFVSYGDRSRGGPLCCPAVVGLRAPPVIS